MIAYRADSLRKLANECNGDADVNLDLDKEILYGLFGTKGWKAWGIGMRPSKNLKDAIDMRDVFHDEHPNFPLAGDADATALQICQAVLSQAIEVVEGQFEDAVTGAPVA